QSKFQEHYGSSICVSSELRIKRLLVKQGSIVKKSLGMFQTFNSTKRNSSHATATQPEPLQKLFDALPTAVGLVDSQGRIQFMNAVAYRLLGKPRKNLKLEDWPQKFGLYLDDDQTLYPGKNLLLARALRGESVEESED